MPLINRFVGHTLPYQMGADGVALQIVLFQQITLLAHITITFQSLVYFKMVAPTGEFQAIEPPVARFLRQRCQR